MEIKLFVRTHKENFGSVLLFSNNMLPKEKRVMEDIKYTNYDPDETEIIEISAQGFYIYFCTYIGGQDEFGRDYQNVIGTIFPFRITESDVLNLRKTFSDIMNNISSGDFSEDNRYFSEIKAKANLKYHSKNGPSFFKINIKRFLIFIIFILIILVSFFKLKEYLLPLFSVQSDTLKETAFNKESIKKYTLLMKYISQEKDSSIQYKLYKELFSEVEKSGVSIKQTEALKKFKEIDLEYKKNNKNITHLNILIDNYLSNPDFKYNLSKVKTIQSSIAKGKELSIFNNLISKIDSYNINPTEKSLVDLISASKNIAPMLSNKERKYIEQIILNADSISKGINLELEIHISEKSAVFNRRTLSFEVQVDSNNSQFKNKPMNNYPNIYAGSFFVKLSPFSKINFKIYDHSYSGKKILLKDTVFNFNELNKPILITDGNNNSFKVELRVLSEKFKIKYDTID